LRISFIFIVVLSLISPITHAASTQQSGSEFSVPKPKNVWMIIMITTFPGLNSASAFQVPRLHWKRDSRKVLPLKIFERQASKQWKHLSIKENSVLVS